MKAEQYVVERLIKAEAEIDRNRKTIEDLKARVTALEGKVERIRECIHVDEGIAFVTYNGGEKLIELLGLMDDGK